MDENERSLRSKMQGVLQKQEDLLKTAEQEKRDLNSVEDAEYRRLNREHDRLQRELRSYLSDPRIAAQIGNEGEIRRRLLSDTDAPTAEERTGGRWGVTIEGRQIPILESRDRMTDCFPRPTDEAGLWSLGDYVRSNMGIRTATSVVSGPATVPTFIGSRIVDRVRAKARVIQAGSVTIPLEGKTNLCKIVSDPTVYQHTEGVADVQESLPVFAPVTLDPGTLVALVPLSMEIVQDSPNLDDALSVSISAAFASKLDTLCMATILADTDIAKSTVAEDPASWPGLMLAVKSMLGANMDLPSAVICGTGDYAARAAEIMAGGDSWLGAPSVLKNCKDLFTTSLTDGTAVMGDFARGFGIAVRQDLRVELVRWGKASSASHVLIATMRAQGYVLQSAALYKALKTVN